MIKNLLLFSLLAFCSFSAFSQLQYDSSFTEQGYYHSNQFYNATSVDIQSDGSIIVSCDASSGYGIMKFKHNGSLDTSFNHLGYRTGKEISLTKKIISLENDQILLVGQGSVMISGGFTTKIKLMKFNKDGSKDLTFGTNGIVVFSHNGDKVETVNDMEVTSEGKIVLGGYLFNGTNKDDFLVIQCNSDGSYDDTFNSTGFKIFDTSIQEGAQKIYSLTLQDDDKIVLGGTTYTDPYNDVVCMRLTTTGRLDGTFSGNGIYVEDKGGANADYAEDIKVLPNGNIVFSVQKAGWSSNKLYSLGSDGTEITDFKYLGTSQVSKFSLFKDKYVVITPYRVELINSDGSKDTEFGSGASLYLGTTTTQYEVITKNDEVYIVGKATFDGVSGMYIYRLAEPVVSSVQDKLESLNSSFYPNPFSENLVFKSSVKAEVVVYNVQGQAVYTGSVSDGDDIGAYLTEKGVYVIKMTNDGVHEFQRIVKK